MEPPPSQRPACTVWQLSVAAARGTAVDTAPVSAETRERLTRFSVYCSNILLSAEQCFPTNRLHLQAFLAASLKTDAELQDWFRERLVWNDPDQVKELVKNGLFYRIYTPQARSLSSALRPSLGRHCGG